MRLAAALPPGDSLGGPAGWYPSLAISPDGSHLAYVATHEGVSQLYLRDMDGWDAQAIPGTVNAHTPFFSPDGQWLGAMVGSSLVKIPVAGGPLATLSTISYRIYGACWASNGWIYLGTEAPLGLVKIPVTGGPALGASAVDDDHGETDHRYPELLPGGKWILVAARKAGHTFDEAEIAAISQINGERRSILHDATNPRYISGGYLAFLRGGTLMAVPFDAATLQLKGEPVALVKPVIENPVVGAGQYSVSADGTLVYAQGNASFAERELVLVDRGGAARVLSAAKQPYEEVAVSPDGRQIAATIGGKTTDIWLHDIASGAEKPFTAGGEHRSPVWSPDGKRLFYAAYTGKQDAERAIFQKAADGTGAEQQLRISETPIEPWFTSPDGQILLYEESGRTGNHAAQSMTLQGKHLGRSLTPRDFDENWTQLSPNGQWLAFNSDESGQQEVYVETFPGQMSRVKVSSGGGTHPQWSADGKELYYRTAAGTDGPRPFGRRVRLMAASVTTTPQFQAGAPHMLFEGPFFEGGHDYAVTPDGKFLLIRESPPAPEVGNIEVVLNWSGELKRRLPARP